MRAICLTFAFVFTATFGSADVNLVFGQYDPVAQGSRTVEIAEDIVLKDAEREKSLHVKIYYPMENGRYPVIVFSHGFGAGKDAFAELAQHWASHGYVLIHPQHADAGRIARSNADEEEPKSGRGDRANQLPKLDREKLRQRLQSSKGQGNAGIDRLANIQNNPQSISDRVRDVTFILDSFTELERQVPGLDGKLDPDRIGVSGHSYGAAVAIMIGGATVDLGNGSRKSFADERIKCVLPFSAAGAGEYGLTAESWKLMLLPVMFVTGTKDIRPGKEFAWRKEAFEGSPNGGKYLVVLEGATHFHFGGGPPGAKRLQGPGSAKGDKYSPLLKSCTTAFLDLHLKGDPAVNDYLKREGGFAKFGGNSVQFTTK